MTRHDDEPLAAAIAAGDETAASRFDGRFRGRLEALARKRGVAGPDCAEVAQEVLTDALRQLREGRFRGEATLATWLHPILRGHIANYFRAHRRPGTVSLDDLGDDHQALVAPSDRDGVLAVQEALSRLSTPARLVLILYYQQGRTLEEIGPLLGLRKSAVWERLQTARAQFRMALRDGGRKSASPRLRE